MSFFITFLDFSVYTKYYTLSNPGHGKIPAPDFNFYTQKDKYPI